MYQVRRWNRFCDSTKKKNWCDAAERKRRKQVVKNFSETIVKNDLLFTVNSGVIIKNYVWNVKWNTYGNVNKKMTYQLLKSIKEYSSQFDRKISKYLNNLFSSWTANSKNIMSSFICYIHFPLSEQWMDCLCKVWLVVSTTSGEGTPELCSSNFGKSL